MYIAAGDYSIAEEMFNQVKEPSVQNYAALMSYHNQSQNWQNTLQLYDRLKTQRKAQPDVPIYLAVLSAIKQTKNTEKAQEIKEDLSKQDLWQNHGEIQKLLKEI